MIGAGNTLGRFTATLGLDTKDYARGIINAQSLNRVFGQSFTAFVSNPLLGSIGLLKQVGGALIRAAGQQLAYAETLQRTSQQLGVSEQLLVALNKRLEVAGFQGDIGAKALQKFATSLLDLQRGAGPLKEVGQAIGLVLDPTDTLDRNLARVLDTIAALPNAAQRSAAAAKIFGEEAGPRLVNAIGGGSQAMAHMVREAQQLGFRVDTLSNNGVAGLNTQMGYLKLAVEGIRFNAMQSFLVGITRSTSQSTEGITQMTDAINRELGPAMESLGRQSVPLLRDTAALLPEVVELLTMTVSAVAELDRLWSGSWVQAARDFIGAGVHRVIAPQEYNLTPGQVRLNEMRLEQRRRDEGLSPLQMTYIQGNFMM